MKSRDIVTEEPKTEKGKTFGTISTKTTVTDQEKLNREQQPTAEQQLTMKQQLLLNWAI